MKTATESQCPGHEVDSSSISPGGGLQEPLLQRWELVVKEPQTRDPVSWLVNDRWAMELRPA